MFFKDPFYSLTDAREMIEYTKPAQFTQRSVQGRHLGVKSILGLDSEDMPTSQMTNMYWASDFSRKLSCVKQYHSAERSVLFKGQGLKVIVVLKSGLISLSLLITFKTISIQYQIFIIKLSKMYILNVMLKYTFTATGDY